MWHLLVCLVFVTSCLAATGIDMSNNECSDTSASQYKCMHDTYGNSFAILEGFRGGYQINEKIGQCVNNAWNAGFSHVDVYGFFCPYCTGNNPCSDAINNILDYLEQNQIKFGTFWLDVEQCSGCWYSDLQKNFEFVQDCANAVVARGQALGIYSSNYEWAQTCGDATGLQQYPLWYANWDGKQSFSDFEPFGGWTTPAMKQYADSGDSSCGVTVDLDWY